MASASSASATFHFKLVLLGNAGVGKSCLVLRFIRNEYYEDNETTIGAAFLTKTLALDDSTMKMEIWDTAGQERYRSLAPMYYRGAQAAIVVFDVTNRGSFEGAKSWVKELQRRAPPELVIALAGNKADLGGQRRVDAEEAQEYATSVNAVYAETSAKGDTGVTALFEDVAKRVPKGKAPEKKEVVSLMPGTAGGRGAAGGKACCG